MPVVAIQVRGPLGRRPEHALVVEEVSVPLMPVRDHRMVGQPFLVADRPAERFSEGLGRVDAARVEAQDHR
ncbi:hypothetical protein [Streptomyces sp. AK02-01A]|uniref:hypothetical protein n=1 Tax=Streptomyces sp. AK02-01A TaxID=3028648 RepID=UPI0029BC61B4|nr:hypothetical protein [Streptomyces sp. AK02-01A]MDX3855661.1 hypothetical protein [Streptomyces sp. AK02-01A]